MLLMDADVLYDEDMLDRLINSPHPNCFLLERAFDPGDEPVKSCIRSGEIVEFRKWLSAEFDFCGESFGFFKLSTEVAKKIIVQTEHYWRQDRRQEPYEEVIRDVLLTSPPIRSLLKWSQTCLGSKLILPPILNVQILSYCPSFRL